MSPLAYTMAKQVDTKLTCYALKIIIVISNTDTIILKGKLAKFVLISEINFYVQLYLVVRSTERVATEKHAHYSPSKNIHSMSRRVDILKKGEKRVVAKQ